MRNIIKPPYEKYVFMHFLLLIIGWKHSSNGFQCYFTKSNMIYYFNDNGEVEIETVEK